MKPDKPGLQDKVDYHLDKLAEATALTTALAYAGNLARNPNSSSGNNGQDVVGDTVAQQANRIGEKDHRPRTRRAADDHDPPGLAPARPREQGHDPGTVCPAVELVDGDTHA